MRILIDGWPSGFMWRTLSTVFSEHGHSLHMIRPKYRMTDLQTHDVRIIFWDESRVVRGDEAIPTIVYDPTCRMTRAARLVFISAGVQCYKPSFSQNEVAETLLPPYLSHSPIVQKVTGTGGVFYPHDVAASKMLEKQFAGWVDIVAGPHIHSYLDTCQTYRMMPTDDRIITIGYLFASKTIHVMSRKDNESGVVSERFVQAANGRCAALIPSDHILTAGKLKRASATPKSLSTLIWDSSRQAAFTAMHIFLSKYANPIEWVRAVEEVYNAK